MNSLSSSSSFVRWAGLRSKEPTQFIIQSIDWRKLFDSSKKCLTDSKFDASTTDPEIELDLNSDSNSSNFSPFLEPKNRLFFLISS